MDLQWLFQYLSTGALSLLDAIMLELSPADLKNLRLCSSYLGSVTIPYLFSGKHTLFISTYPQDLETFQAVLRNSDLRKRVQRVGWDDPTLDAKLKEHENNDHSISKQFRYWGPWVRQHLRSRSQCLDTQVLMEALQHLPKLKTVALMALPDSRAINSEVASQSNLNLDSPTCQLFHSRSVDFYLLRPYFSRANHRNKLWYAMSEHQPFKTNRHLLDLSLIDEEQAEPQFRIKSPSSKFQLSTSGTSENFRTLNGAYNAANVIWLDDFHIFPLSQLKRECVQNHHWFWRDPSPEIDLLRRHFVRLKSLDLSFNGPGKEDEEKKTWACGHLSKALRGIRELEDLRLALSNADLVRILFGNGTEEVSEQVPPYARLKNVTFVSGLLYRDSFIRFLYEHSSTLTSLRLVGVHLQQSSWLEIISEVNRRDIVSLREDFEVEVDNAHDGSGTWSLRESRLPVQMPEKFVSGLA